MPRLIVGRRAALRRRGVTLPELLVAMFLLSVIGASLVRVFAKQQQVYKDLTLTAAAKRELRMGATVLPAELRSISSSGGDILSMSESEMEIRAFIGTSIICERALSGNKKLLAIPPENLAKHTLTTFLSRPVTGDYVFLYNDSLSKGSEDDVWTERQVGATPNNDPNVCVGPPYTDAALDAGKARRTIILNDTLPDSVRTGAVVRFARPVRYKIYQETSGNWYLGMQENLSGNWQGLQPLAGPYRSFLSGDGAKSGLQFRYFDTLGVRITDLTKTKDVGRVDVFLRTNAGPSAITERKGADLQDSVVMRVAIRNSK
ncbi:MAG TPA: prepilin-type N-terminal cleavage/methylation domain-containing protein [Gemmatimonadaceae bacterium]|nr:prepilin-type N-terminal cleavage/methylation domain-containing protein [Gemmatimonadaceae bacterium]